MRETFVPFICHSYKSLLTSVSYLVPLVAIVFNHASEAAAQNEDLTRSLRECANIEDSALRHACYDEVLRPALSGVQRPSDDDSANRDANTLHPTDTSETDDGIAGGSWFGLSRPDEEDQISVIISSVRTDLYGKFIFTTERGQVWEQSDRVRTASFDPPFRAIIRKGSFGGYFILPDDGNAAMRVRRKE